MRREELPDGPLCIDTDVFSYLYTGRGQHVAEFRELIRGHLLVMSFATVGELRAWTLRTKYGERRRADIERRIREQYLVVTPTNAVVEVYGQLHARFTGRLSQGGQNDMWTAACALAQPDPLPVVTNNLGDFGMIAGEFPLMVVHPSR